MRVSRFRHQPGRNGYLRYELEQNAWKLVPSPALYPAEGLGLHQIYSEISSRLNAGRRASCGRYVDLLGELWWPPTARHRRCVRPWHQPR
jgi:hypothetical protein